MLNSPSALRGAVAFLAVVFCSSLASVSPLDASPRAHTPAAHKVHHVRTPADSFLRYKVYSVDQLIRQVQADPQVRRRFANHFHIPESRVVSYMRANLVESYIPQTGRYTVYCVRPAGTIYPVRQTFRKGTKVFALRNGQPVMKWVCGNPLSKFLPAVETRTIVKKVPVVKVSPSIETITPADAEDILVPSEVVTPVFQPAVPAAVGPSLGAAATPIFFGGGGGGSLLPLLLPLAFLSSGGGGSSPVVPSGPAAVPEPVSAVYLIAGLPPLAAVLLRKYRLARNSKEI